LRDIRRGEQGGRRRWSAAQRRGRARSDSQNATRRTVPVLRRWFRRVAAGHALAIATVGESTCRAREPEHASSVAEPV